MATATLPMWLDKIVRSNGHEPTLTLLAGEHGHAFYCECCGEELYHYYPLPDQRPLYDGESHTRAVCFMRCGTPRLPYSF